MHYIASAFTIDTVNGIDIHDRMMVHGNLPHRDDDFDKGTEDSIGRVNCPTLSSVSRIVSDPHRAG